MLKEQYKAEPAGHGFHASLILHECIIVQNCACGTLATVQRDEDSNQRAQGQLTAILLLYVAIIIIVLPSVVIVIAGGATVV